MIKNINKYQLLTPLQCAKMHSIDRVYNVMNVLLVVKVQHVHFLHFTFPRNVKTSRATWKKTEQKQKTTVALFIFYKVLIQRCQTVSAL